MLYNFFSPQNRAIFEMRKKYDKAGQTKTAKITRRMRTACWVTYGRIQTYAQNM